PGPASRKQGHQARALRIISHAGPARGLLQHRFTSKSHNEAMTYGGGSSRRDRARAIAGVGVVHVALAAAILSGLSVTMVRQVAEHLQTFDLRQEPPPPVKPPPPAPKSRQMKKPAGAPAKKAEPSPIVAPEPKLALPSPIPAAKIAGAGSASTSGAAQSGNGTGAGGFGNGRGGGGDYSR